MRSYGYSGTIAHAMLCAPVVHAVDSASSTRPLGIAFQRHRAACQAAAHPLLQQRVDAALGVVRFRSAADGAFYRLVAEHVVQGRVVFPGAGYVEMARSASVGLASDRVGLHGVFFLRPLVLDSESAAYVETTVCDDGRMDVHSRGSHRSHVLEADTHHCTAAYAAAGDAPLPSACALSSRCTRAAGVLQLYDGFRLAGLHYGPAFRMVGRAWSSAEPGLASGVLRRRAAWHGTGFHPADLDGTLQLTALLSRPALHEARLPFAIAELSLRASPGQLWVVRAPPPIAL